MKSIDRLRRYVECHDKITGLTATCINHLIDSIDKEVDDMWHALTIDAKPMTDENMAADGWVRLPVDADGVPWHINDEFEVDEGIAHVNGIGDNRLYYIDGDGMQWTRADNKCHHHAPTVEDVLREFTERLDEIGSEDDCAGVDEQECRACIRRDIAAAYAEYAEKLALRGDE